MKSHAQISTLGAFTWQSDVLNRTKQHSYRGNECAGSLGQEFKGQIDVVMRQYLQSRIQAAMSWVPFHLMHPDIDCLK